MAAPVFLFFSAQLHTKYHAPGQNGQDGQRRRPPDQGGPHPAQAEGRAPADLGHGVVRPPDPADKQAQQQLQERQKLEEMERQREKAFGKKEIPKEAKEVIVTGRQYLKAIRESDERIPGQEVSAKIERLENVVEKIFNRVEQHPELVEDLGKFMDYYLPTTVKLLKAYEELDAQEVQGENITGSKREIEQTLDTIEQAFENLLDSFFEKAAWDISSDISVLHNMFAQEGLTGNDFEKMRR